MPFTVKDAFDKFKSNLELTTTESDDVIGKHTAVRELIRNAYSIKDDFLSGSYARWTKTKPLKDVDIFFVLDPEKEKDYLTKPQALLNAFRKTLVGKYGESAVPQPNFRSVTVNFISNEDEADRDKKAMSIDVVPGFAVDGNYKIPDYPSSGWIKTNPKIHAKLATEANERFSGEWKPLVKMLKKWNEFQGKPIKPSFLIEVMALEICRTFSGGYLREVKNFFATAKARIDDIWADPAGLGPAVSAQMDAERRTTAKAKITDSLKVIDTVIQLDNAGSNGDAVKLLREKIFGKQFPLS